MLVQAAISSVIFKVTKQVGGDKIYLKRNFLLFLVKITSKMTLKVKNYFCKTS